MSRFLWGVLHVAAAAFVVGLGVYVLGRLFPVLLPFLIAVFLSFVIEPLVRLFQTRAHFSRSVAVLAAMGIVFVGVGLIMALIVTRLVAELTGLSVNLPAYVKMAQASVLTFFHQALAYYGRLDPVIAGWVQQAFGALSQSLRGLIGAAVNSLLVITTAIPAVALLAVVILLATYFFSRDRQEIADFVFGLLPAPAADRIRRITREVAEAGLGYLKAELILVGITTALSILGLCLIDAKYALVLGLLVGFLDFIPLGPALFYVPWMAWAFFTGAAWLGVKLILLYVLIFVARQVLENRIVSANLGLHPMAVLVAMYAGLKLMGFWGIAVGLTAVIVLQAVARSGIHFRFPRR